MKSTIKHGTNPENLIDQILRNRIYEAKYYKEECFGLTAETVVDKAMELDAVGGCFGGNKKPSNFLCLILKMLQIQIEHEIIIEFINNKDYKYVTCLGAFYLRLTGTPIEIYNTLEPFYSDYRKIRRKLPNGKYDIFHMDEFIEELLTKEVACDVSLPFITKRHLLEQSGQLKERISALDEDDLKMINQEQQEERKESFKLKFKKVDEEDSSTTDEEEERKNKWVPGPKKKFEWKKEQESEEKQEESLSVEQTNQLRKELGLAPLNNTKN